MAKDEAYLAAEKKIQEALQSGATELDLHNMKLTGLPESIRELTDLQHLNLNSNLLTALPESLGELTKLQILNLSANKLTKLPDLLGTLMKLQSLDLGHNQLAELPDWVGQFTQLQSLELSGNRFSALPESLGNLTNLRQLVLTDPRFDSLPIQICRLQALEILILGTGQYPTGSSMRMIISTGRASLKHLPIELGDLSSLKVLLLGKNQLVDIPFSITRLKNLEVLDLENNPLNPDLAAAHGQGLEAVKAYLRAKAVGRKIRLFLCYASQDRLLVHELYQKIVAEGWIEPWLDAKKLLPGQDWLAEIKNAVETADSVIIFLSNTSVNKDGFIQKELRFAREIALEKTEGSIFLIPLRLDNCEVPQSLRFYQWANYFGEDKEQTYANLLETLKHRLKAIQRKEIQIKQGDKRNDGEHGA